MDAWLYIVFLGAAILLYARLLPKTSGVSVPSDMMKEIEDAIDHFSSEMEEENQQMMKLVSGMKGDHEAQVRSLMERIDYLERQSRGLSEQVSEISKAKPLLEARAHTAEVNAKPHNPQETPGMNIKSRYVEVFRLQTQGKSTEFIAKKLGMNKGEVMLILQLGKQEEDTLA